MTFHGEGKETHMDRRAMHQDTSVSFLDSTARAGSENWKDDSVFKGRTRGIVCSCMASQCKHVEAVPEVGLQG